MSANVVNTQIDNVIYVDGKEIQFSDEKNLLEVLRNNGIDVPAFCYRPDLTIYGACRMCVVEIEGMGIQTSCTMQPQAGMKIKVNTPKTRSIRRMSLELLLANHKRDCTTCEKSNNCDLQALSNKMGISKIRFDEREIDLPIDDSNPSIVRDPNKCILCGACVRTCNEIQGQNVLDFSQRGSNAQVGPAYGKNLNEVDCVYCGQCVSVCPTGALAIKSDVEKFWDYIFDQKKRVVAQIAPAVRVAVGEAFGIEPGKNSIGLIAAALKSVGIDQVFDTSFAADLTIMEEGTELLSRVAKNENLPLITSCCPAWVRYAEFRYPQLLKNLSSCKSPQQMFGSVAKKVLAKKEGIDPRDMIVVSIMPCTAKKAERERPEFKTNGVDDVDLVITTQELIRIIKESGIDLKNIKPDRLDTPFGILSGAGVIFGSSGGVAEAAVRTAYELVTDEPLKNISIKEARGLKNLKEFTVDLKDKKLKVAVISSLKKASEVLELVEKGEADYDFIEIMACPGGCISGAGQPPSFKDASIKQERSNGLYEADVILPLHKSHENPEIINLYKKWLESPNSEIAHELLHTKYKSKKRIDGEFIELIDDKDQPEQVEVKVCVGTCCYLKGSYSLIEELMGIIKANKLEHLVKVNATFCFENCESAPSISINGQVFSNIKANNAQEVYEKYIFNVLKK